MQSHVYFVLLDIDECNTAQHNCTELQTCTNTPGSFVCSCLPGYTESLISPLLCEGITCIPTYISNTSVQFYLKILIFSLDVNECDEGSDGCHQICTNTNGSFECSCQPEFELLPDQRRCNGTCFGNIKFVGSKL